MKERKSYPDVEPTSPFWESVKAKYPNHWVLIGNPILPEGEIAIQGGEVVFASDKRDDITTFCREHRGSGTYRALRYTGERPRRLFLYTFKNNKYGTSIRP